MGNFFTSDMKKNQENMQKKMMERQMKLQFQMLERQLAMQVARSRDLFAWVATFYATAAFGMFSGYRKTKRPALIAPLVPLTFVTVYFWDLAYGNKMQRIRIEAEHILSNETDYLKFPGGLPSLASIDDGLRFSNVEEQKSDSTE